jgi:type I restriction enzyme S subunit
MNTTAGVGGSLVRARPEAVSKILVPLPSLNEQRRIAEILDQADELRRKRRRALARLSELPQAIFHETFGDPIRNDRAWGLKKLTDLLTGFDSGKNIVADDAVNPAATYRVLKINAVGIDGYDPGQTKALPNSYVPPAAHRVRSGDLLITRANTRELVGRVALVEHTPDNLYLPDKILRFAFRPQADVEVRYIQAVFEHPAMRRLLDSLATGTSGSMKNLSQSKLLAIKIAVPPIELQRNFSAAFNYSSGVISTQRQQLTLLNKLFVSLQHRAFADTLAPDSLESTVATFQLTKFAPV